MADKKQGWGIVVGFVLAAMVLGVCVACDDDDDEDSWAPATELVASHGDRDKGRNSRGDCEGSRDCQDNDGINADKVIICIQPSSCQFGEGETAALFPPNPEQLVKTIQTGAAAIGKSAGEMAGAIAALPIGILLSQEEEEPQPVKAVPHIDPYPSVVERREQLPETM